MGQRWESGEEDSPALWGALGVRIQLITQFKTRHLSVQMDGGSVALAHTGFPGNVSWTLSDEPGINQTEVIQCSHCTERPGKT